jgi:DNA-binding NarL/FixJ family response regulator
MIRVAIVDDHPVFRHGLEHAVESAQGLVLVAAAGSVEDLRTSDLGDVDVVVLDLGLPGVRGKEAVSELCEKGLKLLVVSAAGGRRDVLDAIAAGAAGYLTKSAEPAEITRAVAIVAKGETYVSPALASFFLDSARNETVNSPLALALTKRERDVLALVASGERDADIAEELCIAVATVHSHLDRIRDKTGRRRRADLTRLAFEEGIAPGESGRA